MESTKTIRIRNPGKLQGLQVLRGVAASLVVWCHLKYALGMSVSSIANHPWLATDIGAIGVDIFFVISGYVIALTAARLGKNWQAFLANRISRIVPFYLLISCFMLVRLVALSGNLRVCLQDYREIFNSFFFLPLLDRGGFTTPMCSNGWTLSFEFWFYLSFAILMSQIGQRAGKALPAVMATGVAITAICYHSDNWFLPKFLFHPLTLEFCAGCLLYQLRNWMGLKMLVLLSLLLPAFLFWSNREQSLGQHWQVLNQVSLGLLRAGLWGGFAVCLVGVVTQLDLKHPLNWPVVLLLVGDASYSIYLIGPIVTTIIHGATYVLHLPTGATPTQVARGICFLALDIGGGILSWKYVEVPLTSRAKKLLTRYVPVEVVPQPQTGMAAAS
jgi:peptidoglycan/LPS O-acetylase OafA/YrhL